MNTCRPTWSFGSATAWPEVNLNNAWPFATHIDVHIRKLREKLGDEYFKTVKGVGYKFVD